MEGSDDYPAQNPPAEEVMYPDIDETIHYPWQGNQPAQHDSSTTSALDPRLYRDLFSRSTSQLIDQHVPESDYDEEEGDADELSFASGEREDQQFVDGDDYSDDPSYDVSEENST